jgi:hypothetical protein
MDTLAGSFEPGRLGVITAETDDLPSLVGPDGQPITGTRHVWRPSPELLHQLPEGYSFAMRCVVGPDGLRRFYPGSFEGQIATAFQGGLAILSLMGNLSPEQRYSYRAMYLLFERLRKTREHLGNALLNATSLRVSRVGRDVAEERSILPESVGQDSHGQGRSWSVDQLVREGREAAVAAGIQRPGEEDCVRYGLVAAARRNPLYLRPQEVLPLVRMALYESVPVDEPLGQELLGLVLERTLAAVQGHLTEPANEFNAWFSGPKNSFVQQIARRKLLPGGVLDRDLVRRALLKLGWQAYSYVADCIHAMMWVFQHLLSEPLSATEAAWFEQMHLEQFHFGNLPLVLLVERFRLVKDVLWEIWQGPCDPGPVAVLHRLLSYYAEMASARRATDRTVKQRRPGKQQPGHRTPLTVPLEALVPAEDEDATAGGEEEDTANEENLDEPEAPEDAAVSELFAQVAELVRERCGVTCRCVAPQWVDRVTRHDETMVTLTHGCSGCDFTIETTLPLEELRRLAGA